MSPAATATANSEPSRSARNTQAGSSGPFEFLSIACYTAGAPEGCGATYRRRVAVEFWSLRSARSSAAHISAKPVGWYTL